MLSIGKHQVSTHKAIKKVLCLPMRYSNVNVLYVPTSLKNNRTRMSKLLSTLEKMHPYDTDIFAPNIIGRYKN